ncbi:MAG: hypothetical protein ACOYMF_08225 [Bacteroidales bacterium]
MYACLSHIPLSEKGVDAIEKSEIDLVISTDSLTNDRVKKSSKIKVISVAPLFAEVIRRMQNRHEINALWLAFQWKCTMLQLNTDS